MLKKVIGIVAGLIAGFVVTAILQMISAFIYPMPADIQLSDYEALGEWIKSLPVGAFLIVLVSHVLGAATGAFVCAAIVPQRWITGSLIIGGLLLLAGIMNLVAIPHPIWFAIVDLISYIPAALVGATIGEKVTGKTAAPPSTDA